MLANRQIWCSALQSIKLLSAFRKHIITGQDFFSGFNGQISFSLLFIGRHLGSIYTGTDRKGPDYRIGPKRA